MGPRMSCRSFLPQPPEDQGSCKYMVLEAISPGAAVVPLSAPPLAQAPQAGGNGSSMAREQVPYLLCIFLPKPSGFKEIGY